MASGMLSEHQIVHMYAYRLRSHYLVSLLVGQHAVLMYAGLVRESIFAYYRLVERRSLSDYVVYRLARAVDLSCVDACCKARNILSCADRHYDLFEGCVSCSFAQTVDGALHLSCSSEHSCQSVCGGHAKIVMTVD